MIGSNFVQVLIHLSKSMSWCGISNESVQYVCLVQQESYKYGPGFHLEQYYTWLSPPLPPSSKNTYLLLWLVHSVVVLWLVHSVAVGWRVWTNNLWSGTWAHDGLKRCWEGTGDVDEELDAARIKPDKRSPNKYVLASAAVTFLLS